jgi:hypothetical protein
MTLPGPWVNAYLNHEIPDLPGDPEVSDVGGYAGDLISALTAIHTIRTANPDYTVDEWISGFLFKNVSGSNFSWVDLIQDCEGYLIAKAYLADPGAGIESAIKARLDQSPNRLSAPLAMWAERFGSSPVDLETNSTRIFFMDPDTTDHILFIAARAALLSPVTIDEFSSADLHDLADGFTTSFIATINT